MLTAGYTQVKVVAACKLFSVYGFQRKNRKENSSYLIDSDYFTKLLALSSKKL